MFYTISIVIVWRQVSPQKVHRLKTWSLAGGTILEGLEPVGGRA
jgi:hypothetical protein